MLSVSHIAPQHPEANNPLHLIHSFLYESPLLAFAPPPSLPPEEVEDSPHS